MDAGTAAAALGAGLLLLVLWVVHLRRDVDRRAARASEWEADTGRGEELWSSAVRCTRCHARHVVLSREGTRLWHTCLDCGHRLARQTHA